MRSARGASASARCHCRRACSSHCSTARPAVRTTTVQAPAADAARRADYLRARDAIGRSVDHSIYDKRGYPIVDVREGYGEWARTYEQTVPDEMDLRLLETVQTVDWAQARSVLDLACGTG